MKKPSFYNFPRSQLVKMFSHLGESKAILRAEKIFQLVYGNKISQLGKDLDSFLEETFSFETPMSIHTESKSAEDGSYKFLYALEDGQLIESVLIPERNRLTQCISTQVGCAQACRFCQTGRMGLSRQLTTAEIVGQVIAAEKWRKENGVLGEYDRITNIVYMGMGEPLDNIQAVIESAQIFVDEKGLMFSPNKVTVSTVGLLPALHRLFEETRVAVALSLHSPYSEKRSQIMPVNIKHPIEKVVEAFKSASEKKLRKSFMFQYTLIRGVNDDDAHALAIADLLKGLPVKMNLIPLNEHKGTSYRRPDLGRVYGFQKLLKQQGIVATVRLSKGRDIAAACGQLIQEKKIKV